MLSAALVDIRSDKGDRAMDYNYENTGCGGLFQNFFGVLLITVAASLLFGNFLLGLFAVGILAFAYGAWPFFFLALIGMLAYPLILGSYIEMLKNNLRQARLYKDYATKSYAIVFIALLIPIILGAFFHYAHVGSFYSLSMLAWSFFAVMGENR
jgi:hypothetical protein